MMANRFLLPPKEVLERFFKNIDVSSLYDSPQTYSKGPSRIPDEKWRIERIEYHSDPLSFDDSTRQSGLYILGKPRMGKSWLMVHLMLQDREKGHGIFFIDPHGDAIDKLLHSLTPRDLQTHTVLLDPEDPQYSFGINLLECNDITDIKARNDTFTRAKGVFDKLWKDTFEDKPWLQLILQNTIYAFIENQGYTLAEFPYFYRDQRFREAIAKNMRYNRIVKNYWLDFGFRSKRLQEDQLEAAHTRIEIMLGQDYVADIVGQAKTTIDFNQILDGNYILLVKLSTHLADESKRIIGTLLVSELLHAIQHRQTRDQFCIYIDEFQNFADFQDFPVLITQAPKFGIATTLAHHERYGQLAGNPQILGATAAIANKVLFQVTPRDASELAPEFADKPPTETRREEQFIISRAPVYDLLKWHDNPKIREYVNKYIRPMKERLEDITGEVEAERLIRTEYLDDANLFRIEDQMLGSGRFPNIDPERRALQTAGHLIKKADRQTARLMSLNEEVARIRLSFRELNKVITALMEGKAGVGSPRFNEFLFNAVNGMSELTEIEREALKYYIKLMNKDYVSTRFLPLEVAKGLNLLPEKIAEEKRRYDDSWYEAAASEQRPRPWPEHQPLELTTYDMEDVKRQIYHRMEGTIDSLADFLKFCQLMMYPENRSKVKSGQYIEREVNARTEQDMIGERARELMALPKYTVYVRKLEGRHSTGVYKTSTEELPETRADYDDIDRMIRRTREFWCRRRYDIQNDIYNRQMPEADESEPPPLWG